MSDPPSPSDSRQDAQTWALFLLLSAIWGSSYLFIKIALDEGVPPFTVVSLRTIFGDGAAATLIEASESPTLSAFQFGTDGAGADPSWQIDRLSELTIAMPSSMSDADRETVRGFAARIRLLRRVSFLVGEELLTSSPPKTSSWVRLPSS